MGDRLEDERTQVLWVHSSIDDMTNLSPNAMRVYMHLVRRANADGMAWPSYQKIGDHCFASVSDKPATRKTFARNAIEELIAAELILKEERVRDDGGQSSNAYILANPKPSMGVLLSTGGAYKGMARAYQAPELNTIEGTPIKKESAESNGAGAPLASQHPAVLVFHDVWKRNPNKPQMKAISDHVTDLELWRDACQAWGKKGHRPTNVEGMLDFYDHPERFRIAYRPPPSGGDYRSTNNGVNAVMDYVREKGLFK